MAHPGALPYDAAYRNMARYWKHLRPDFDAVARAALNVLLRQISTGEVSGEGETIAPTLVTRESVAAPRPSIAA